MKEKIKNFIFNALMCYLLFLLFPFLLLLLIGSLLYTPIDFIKFKRSRHQKDFPRKYTWLCGRHPDNAAYTVTKERNLPVTYLQNNNPELTGVFLYKHTVLHFSNPFFFDDKKRSGCFGRTPRTKKRMKMQRPRKSKKWKKTTPTIACLSKPRLISSENNTENAFLMRRLKMSFSSIKQKMSSPSTVRQL